MKKIKIILLATLTGLLMANPLMVLAVDTSPTSGGIGITDYKGVDSSITQYLCTPSEPADGHDVERCVNKLYRFGVSFGGIALVFFLIFAGYMYMTGGESGKTKAKGILQNSLVGMAILIGSYVLIRFINPNILLFKPIQPPIFTANDLPSCEDVGFGGNCVLPSDEPGKSATLNPGGGKTLSAAELKDSQTKFEQAYSSIGVISKSKWGGKTPTQPLIGNPSPTTIVVHHTAGSSDTPQSIEAFHMSKWSDIGYHFIITKDGKIYQGRYGGPDVMGAHAGGANSGTIGIVLVGNYEEETVGNASAAALQKLVTSIKSKYSINKISMHREMGTTKTACPGKNLVPIVKRLALTQNTPFTYLIDFDPHYHETFQIVL